MFYNAFSRTEIVLSALIRLYINEDVDWVIRACPGIYQCIHRSKSRAKLMRVR